MAKDKDKNKAIQAKIEKQKRKLHQLMVEAKIQESDNPREIKALMKAADILYGLEDVEDELPDAIMEVVNEMAGIEEGDED